MLGAIAGDIIGMPYEGTPIKTTDFPLFAASCTFTDDTVLTVAVAEVLLDGADYVDLFKDYFHLYPQAGYGDSFFQWAQSYSRDPYNSWGNGSAMRVSPIGWAFDTLEEVLAEARRSAEVTHNHPEGIKGAQTIAACIFLARQGENRPAIRRYVESQFEYDLSVRLDDLRRTYSFDVSCQGSVPPAIIAFLESENYEDAVRKAVSLGGDSDTLACMTGGIAQAFYGGVPEFIAESALALLDRPLRNIVTTFSETFACP